MQIPYKIEEEFKLYPNATSKHTSCLCFIYTNTENCVVDMICSVDESYLYKMLIFPSKLRHLVYPFYTSNKERITVSGNVKFFVG